MLRRASIAFIASGLLTLHIVEAQQQPSARELGSASSEMNAFAGTWEIDLSRTKIGALIISFEQAGDSIRATNPRGTYTFKIDGKEYPAAAPGRTVSWRQVDKNTFESTSRRNGEIEGITTRVLSADGKTMDVTTKTMGDKPSTVKSRMVRQSAPAAGKPLMGTWKHVPETSSMQNARMTYTPVANGLHVRYEGPMRQEYTLIFDGKERSADPNSEARFTAHRINERSFEERWTRDGKLFTTSTITVSPDGQELTERHQPGAAGGEPSIYVFRRAR